MWSGVVSADGETTGRERPAKAYGQGVVCLNDDEPDDRDQGGVMEGPLTDSPFDAVLWDWTNALSVNPLAAAVAAAEKRNMGKSVQVVFETVFTDDGHPFDHIRPRGVLTDDRRVVGSVELLRLTDPDGQWVLAAFPTRHEGVFHLVSGLPMTSPRAKRVERWVTRARRVSRCFLNHEDFASIGDRLSEFGNVEVVKLAARVVKDGSSINRGFPIRAGSLRPSHHDEIAEVEGLGATVRTLTLYVSDVLHVHLRRVAGATYYSGDFELFQEQVLTRLEDATATRRKLLTGRQRTNSTDQARPVTVMLGDPLMVTPEDTAHILDAVRAMTDVSMAVFHRNPYLHFVVTDEFDGSNFDVMVTREDAIDIYPGFRASASALARIAQRLGEHFGAFAITNPIPVERVSVYDLMTG